MLDSFLGIEAHGVAQMREPVGSEAALDEQVAQGMVRVGMMSVQVERGRELGDRVVGVPRRL